MVDAVDVPVIAAGGIADGRQFAAESWKEEIAGRKLNRKQ